MDKEPPGCPDLAAVTALRMQSPFLELTTSAQLLMLS